MNNCLRTWTHSGKYLPNIAIYRKLYEQRTLQHSIYHNITHRNEEFDDASEMNSPY